MTGPADLERAPLRAMPKRGGWPASRFLLLIVAAALLPSVLISGMLIWDIADRHSERRQEELQARAETMIQVVDQQIVDSITVLQVLASSDALREGDFETFHRRVKRALLGRTAHAIVLDADLNQILNTRVPYGTPLGKTSDPASALAAADRHSPAVSTVFFGKVAQASVFNVVMPVNVDREIRYFLILTRNAATLEPLLNRTHVPAAKIALIDQAGQVVATSSNVDQVDDAKLLERMIAASRVDGGAKIALDAAGRRHLFVHARSRISDWRVIKYVPEDELDALLRKSLQLLAGTALLTLALSLALTIWVTRLLTRPLGQLAAIADHRPDRPPPRETRVREINIVAAALADEAAERAKLLDRQRLLLREMAHRMLNQFTVVGSIFYQTSAAASSIAELEEAFEARLQGLSRTVLALAQEEWRSVPLHDLVRAHLSPLVGEDDGRIQLDGPDLKASPTAVEMLGLALHELATNSLKYGALSAEGGSVRIAWRRVGGADGFRMEWRESGGPPPTPSGRTGFGSLVLSQIVPAQFDGEASLNFDPEGLRWRLDCPWTRIAD